MGDRLEAGLVCTPPLCNLRRGLHVGYLHGPERAGATCTPVRVCQWSVTRVGVIAEDARVGHVVPHAALLGVAVAENPRNRRPPRLAVVQPISVEDLTRAHDNAKRLLDSFGVLVRGGRLTVVITYAYSPLPVRPRHRITVLRRVDLHRHADLPEVRLTADHRRRLSRALEGGKQDRDQ